MRKHGFYGIARKGTALLLAASLSIGSAPAVSTAKTGAALDVGHPVFKNMELLDKVYTLQPDDYTVDSQLMKIYAEDMAAGGESFYIDRVLKRSGDANGDAGSNGNDDGDTFMTRGRALYMYTSNPDVVGFGGECAYHQPFGKGSMYEIHFLNGEEKLATREIAENRENMPSHWKGEYTVADTGVTAQVQKFIGYQNVAVTLVTLQNKSDGDKKLTLSVDSPFAANPDKEFAAGKEADILTGSVSTPSNLTTVKPKLLAMAGNDSFALSESALVKEITVPAGKSVEVKAVMAFTSEEIPQAQEDFLRYAQMTGNQEILKTQMQEYNLWWAQTMPFIDVPNKAVQKAIDYRWWLENFNKLDANIPGYDYQYPVTIEGVLGYNNAIVLTQPMHLQDTKWMRDASLPYGQLLSVGNSSQSSAFLDNPGNRSNWNNHYGQYLGSAGLEAYKVIGGNREIAETFAYYFEHDAKGQIDHYGNHTSATTPENKLIDYYSAFMTGNDADTISFAYPGAGKFKTHAENAYVYGAARASANLYEIAGNPAKSEEMNALADEIQKDALEFLWCEKDQCFETRAVDPQKGFVAHNEAQPNLIPYKENNNFNYFSEGLVPTDEASIEKYGKMLSYLSYADEFPIFPYYTANQVDNQKQHGSNNFSNINFTVQARAYEAALRTYDKEQKYVTDDMLAAMVEWCAFNMYPDGGDIRYPNNNEFFNIDGKDYETYYRSWIYHNILGNYNYIFVEDVAGMIPREDEKIELDPIDFSYDHFMINNIRYHGKDLTIVWDNPEDATDYYGGAIADGFSLYVDGEHAFTLNKKAHVIYENGTLTFPDGEPEGLTKTVGGAGVLSPAMEVELSENVKEMLKKSGIEVDLAARAVSGSAISAASGSAVVVSGSAINLAKGAKVTSSYTPEHAREAAWATKHRSDGNDETSKAVNEEKPDPQAITDGVTVNMPFWGNDGSENASDYVEIDLGGEKTVDMLNIYFYNDRQKGGYTEPGRYTVEYWDGDKWEDVEKQTRTPLVPRANYNTCRFQAVTTDKIRITVTNKEGHFTAITEVQLYEEGGARDTVENENTAPKVALYQDTSKQENRMARVYAECEDDGRPWDGTLTYSWKVIEAPEGAEVIFSNPKGLATTVSATVEGEYKLSFTADDGELSTTETITVDIRESAVIGNVDIAVNATPGSDYTASWENLNGINDPTFEPANSNPGTGKGWGNWQGLEPGKDCYVSYTWEDKVEISGCDIYWYDDGGGTRVPASISFQYKDDNGDWQDAVMKTDFSDANKIARYNTIALESFETKELRLNMVTQASATGILRFKVYSTPIEEILPVFIGTKKGTIPQLPQEVYAVLPDGSLTKVAVSWNEITQEQVEKDGDFTVSGVNSGTGKFVKATIYVKSDMDKAIITEIADTQVTVVKGKEAYLPETVKAGYNNGAYDNVHVKVAWPKLSLSDYPTTGTYSFEGTVEGKGIEAKLIIHVVSDMSRLEAEINRAEELVEGDYTKESYALLKEALEAAKALKNTDSQEKIDEACRKLKEAQEALVHLANTEELKNNIALAESLTEKQYTKESLTALKKAVEAAKKSLLEDIADQKKIDASNDRLLTAFSNLVKTGEKEMLLHYSFEPDEDDPTRIKDGSAGKYDAAGGKITKDNWVSGLKGKALSMGENTSFAIPAKEAIAPKDITISYWVKRTAELKGDNNILWSKKASTYNGNGFYINNPVNDGYSTFFIMDGFNGFYVEENPNDFFEQDEWTHVAITWDSQTKKGNIYKNGVRQPIVLMGNPQSITGDAEASNLFGENGYGGSGYPDGMVMDEFAIYNNSLAGSEVEKLYHSMKPSENGGQTPDTPDTPDTPGSSSGSTAPEGSLTDGLYQETTTALKDGGAKITLSAEDEKTGSKITGTVKKNKDGKITSLQAGVQLKPQTVLEEGQTEKTLLKVDKKLLEGLESLATKETPLKLRFDLSKNDILPLVSDKTKKTAEIQFMLGDGVIANEKVEVSTIKLEREVVNAVMKAKTKVYFPVVNEKGEELYRFKLNGPDMAKAKQSPHALNLYLETGKQTANQGKKQEMITWNHKGRVPKGVTIFLPMQADEGYQAGQKVSIYTWDKSAGQVDKTTKKTVTIRSDQTIAIKLKKGGDYCIRAVK